MADWSLPTLTSTYANFRQNLTDRDVDIAIQFQSGTFSNVPTNAIKWDTTLNRWHRWSGTAWAELTATYALTGLTCTSFSNTGNTTLGDSSADSVTSNAATWTFANATTIGGNITYSGAINFTGSVTIGDAGADTLTVNATPTFLTGVNFRVGSNAYNTIQQGSSATNSGYMETRNGAGVRIGFSNWWDGTNYYAAWTEGATPVQIGTNGNTRLYIDGSGNVGVNQVANLNARLSLGALVSNKIFSLFDDATNQYGMGIASAEYRIFSATGASIAFGTYARGTDTFTQHTKLNSFGGLTSADLADAVGYKGLPQNAKTGAYTLLISDIGKHISITTGGVTIPANSSVAFQIGSTIVIYNDSSSTQNIAITTDTLLLAGTATGGAGAAGTRTLAQRGLATLVKVGLTTWVISGAGVA